MISAAVRNKILQSIQRKTGVEAELKSVQKFHGGSINDAYRVEATAEIFFLKINEAKKFPGMFACEAKGLVLLGNTGCIHVPAVIETGEAGEEQYLLMEYIFPGSPQKDFHSRFGKSLAQLHKNSATLFGLEYDNYIGSLPQSNKQHKTWIDFFINERIIPQLKMAVDSGAAEKQFVHSFDKLFAALPEIIPDEKPALLHGDLWSGNYACGKNSVAWIFDPAVYYGHREADIAMTKLFGGFAADFYSGYNEEFPLQQGWEKRLAVFNLYPLLVHVNLFGGHYIYEVESILEKF